VEAVALGVLAGALFGAMTVAVRWGLVRGADPIAGAAVVTATGLAVGAVLAAPSAVDGVPWRNLLPFFVIGALVPGVSQILFIHAVREAGPSRAAIVIGTAPLLSVLLALVLLDEPFQAALLLATALVVAGGAVLVAERSRPADFRAVGAVLALVCAALFACRDNAVRWVARDDDVPPLQATAASLLSAALVMAVFALVRRRGALRASVPVAVRAFWPAGVMLGFAYAALVTAFDRGRVGIIAPLNATQSLWGVVFAVIVYRRAEVVGRATVVAAVLIVAGGAVIGVMR
jgi:drug/metabolite transporter (DMT)-like permease